MLYALGLSVYRQQRPAEAVTLLAQAAANARACRAIRLRMRWRSNRRDKLREALKVIDAARLRHPDDRDLLDAGLSIARKAGDTARAREYVRQLLRLAPGDPGLIQLAAGLGVR